MASNGSTSVAATSYDTLKFSWWEIGQSVTANTTTIGWKMELIAGQYGRISATAQSPWEIVVNGTTYTGKENIGIANNATKTLASGETVISHKPDGSQSFDYSFSQVFNITFDKEWLGTISGSGSGTLNTIPRATTPTVSNDNVSMGSLIRINTPRASSRFTHNLDYSFAGGAWVSIKDGVGAYYDWTTPDLATQIPNSVSGTLTIRCITKDGTTTVGTKTTTMTLRVNDSVVPTLSVKVEEATAGIAAQFGGYVKSKSTLKVTITAAGAKGSTVKSYYSTFDGRVYEESSFTTPALSINDTLDLVVTVSDSRGRTATETVPIVVMGYSTPAISSLQVYRVNAEGEADPDGTYVAARYAYSVQPLQNKNTATMVLEYKRTTDASWSQLLTSTALSADTTAKPTTATFSTDYQYDLRMTVTDWFGSSASYPTSLPSGAVILDISADGKGVGIGTTAQGPGFEVGWQMETSGGFKTIPLPSATDLNTLFIPNTYGGKAWNSYINCPDTSRDFTLEVLPAGADGQLMQRLTTCVPLSPVEYTRFYVSGAWQAWAITGFESIWQGATLGSSFALYDSAAAVQYRRSGGVVEVRGVVKPTKTITNADGWVTITTLPTGYTPGGANEVNCVCQGGGAALWLLRITTAGAVQFSRYQQGGNYADVTSGTRLPFSVTFLANR